MKVELEKIKPIMSKYINEGYKKDKIKLVSVDISENMIEGILTVTDYMMPSDGVYHFDVIHAELWVGQLMLIFGSYKSKWTKQPGEAYMRKFTIKCKKRITKTNNISIKLKIMKIKKYNNKLYLKGNFTIDGGNFLGTISVIMNY